MSDALDEEVARKCSRKIKALETCYARYRTQPERGLLCRQLNYIAAMCLVSLVCQDEVDAVKTYCSSLGTAKKSKQCRVARENLSICLDVTQQNQLNSSE